MEALLKERKSRNDLELLLNKLLVMRKEKISWAALNLIPESPIVSLIILIIQEQHGLSDKKVPIDLLINKTLSHDEVVLLNLYLFDHPNVMKIFIENYMKVRRIELYGNVTRNDRRKIIH